MKRKESDLGIVSGYTRDMEIKGAKCSFCGNEVTRGGYWAAGGGAEVYMCYTCATGQPVAATVADAIFDNIGCQRQLPFGQLREFELAFWQAYATALVFRQHS